MRLPSARGVVVSVGLASVSLWLSAAVAQADGPVPGVTVPKAPVGAVVSKAVAPVVSKVAEVAKPATAPARSVVGSATTTVSHTTKTLSAPPAVAEPVQTVEQRTEPIVREVTEPVEHVVEAVAPVEHVVEAVAPVEPVVEAVAPLPELQPTIDTVTEAIDHAVVTPVVPPLESGPEPTEEVPVTTQGDPIVIVAAPSPAKPVMKSYTVVEPVISEDPVIDDDTPVVADEPAPALAPGEAPPAPASITPLLEVLAIHDAPPPITDIASSPTLVVVVVVVVVEDVAPTPVVPASTDVLDVSAPSLSHVVSPESWTGLAPRQASTPGAPWRPLPIESSAAPVPLPTTTLGLGGAPPGAAPPPSGALNLANLWQALRQLARLHPVSIAFSNLAPPG